MFTFLVLLSGLFIYSLIGFTVLQGIYSHNQEKFHLKELRFNDPSYSERAIQKILTKYRPVVAIYAVIWIITASVAFTLGLWELLQFIISLF